MHLRAHALLRGAAHEVQHLTLAPKRAQAPLALAPALSQAAERSPLLCTTLLMREETEFSINVESALPPAAEANELRAAHSGRGPTSSW